MNTKHKIVEVNGQRYSLRKLPPEVGSFIFMRMLGASMRSAAEQPPSSKPQQTESAEPETKITGEMRVRALSFAVFSGGMGFDDFKFIQTSCMKVVSRVDVRDGVELPMPVMTDSGEWADQQLAEDVGAVMRLTTEELIFCFSDFFDGSGLGI